MKYLLLLCIFFVGCSQNEKFKPKVGMIVTNGYCTGQVTYVWLSLDQVTLLDATCGNTSYQNLTLNNENIREVK